MLEGSRYIVGDIEKRILKAEISSNRSDFDFDEQVGDVFLKQTITRSDSSPMADGVGEEFGTGLDDQDENDVVFEKKTGRSLFETPSELLTDCLPPTVVSDSKQKETSGQSNDRKISIENPRDCVSGDMRGKEMSMMPPPPPRPLTRIGTPIKKAMKRVVEANSEVEDFKKSKRTTDATTESGSSTRRSLRVCSSKDTPRYKKKSR